MFQNDRYGLWKTFNKIYKIMKHKSPDDNAYPLMEEMLSDLKIDNRKFISLTEVVNKYVIYFA